MLKLVGLVAASIIPKQTYKENSAFDRKITSTSDRFPSFTASLAMRRDAERLCQFLGKWISQTSYAESIRYRTSEWVVAPSTGGPVLRSVSAV